MSYTDGHIQNDSILKGFMPRNLSILVSLILDERDVHVERLLGRFIQKHAEELMGYLFSNTVYLTVMPIKEMVAYPLSMINDLHLFVARVYPKIITTIIMAMINEAQMISKVFACSFTPFIAFLNTSSFENAKEISFSSRVSL